MKQYLRKLFGGPPDPKDASPEQVEQYNRQYLQANSRQYKMNETSGESDPTLQLPTAWRPQLQVRVPVAV